MNVCLFCDSFLPKVAGMELVVHYLANALCEIGIKVTVIAKHIMGQTQFENQYRLIRYGGYFPGSGRTGVDFVSAIFTLLKEHRRSHFDVIHCHTVAHAGNRAVFANKFIRAPLVMTPHGKDIQRIPEIAYGYRLSERWDRIIKRNLGRADAITAISDAVREELTFVPEDRVFVVANGIDTKRFFSHREKYLHDLLSIDKETKIVLSVGRNHIKKGYEQGIQAFKVLNEKNQCKELVYVIIGRDVSHLAPLVRRLSLNGKVFLLPQQDHETIVKCYQSAWCFFSPSIVEGLSLVSIEAMATGLPLIVTDVPGNLDIVRDNQCGLIVRNADPLSMAEGLMTLLSDDQLHNEYSRIALERAQLYDWGNIARQYLRVYKVVEKNHGKELG